MKPNVMCGLTGRYLKSMVSESLLFHEMLVWYVVKRVIKIGNCDLSLYLIHKTG